MTRVQLAQVPVVELRKLAGQHGVVGASRLRKEVLVERLAQAMGLAAEVVLGVQPNGLSRKTVHQLRRMALDRGVKGAARMNKEGLLARLTPALDGGDEATSSSAATPETRRVIETGFSFPETYGVNRAVLLVRDPDWLYAYWDISGETWAALIQEGVTHPGKGWQRVLRVHDVTDLAEGELGEDSIVQDIELGDTAREWYFKSPDAERVYLVELGYRAPDGRFLLVARSNLVHVPRKQPSNDMDERWGTLYHEAYRLSLAGSDPTRPMGASEVTQRLQALLGEGVSSGHFGVPPRPVAVEG